MEVIARTKVWHEGRVFTVSTINRRSSAAAAPHMVYTETLVFLHDPKGEVNGVVTGQGEDCPGCISTHLDFVKQIHETGEIPYS